MTVTVDAYFPVRVTTIAERDAQPMVEGLRCFVHETLSEYVYNSGVWVLVVTAITPETQTALDGKANSLTADQNYVTDAQLIVVGNTSSTNTGDNSTNSQYSGLAASKQDTLVSAANIKTINGSTVLGSGDLVVGGAAAWGTITGTLSSQTDLQAALDAKADDLGADDNYVTDAEKVVIGNTSGTNTGNQTLPTDATIATTDVTTNNATAAKHGWLQKLPGGTSTFLRADGAFAAPTASVAISEAEIDVGTTPVQEATIAVTDAGISASSKIIGGLAYVAPTGKDLDELEMDALDIKFQPATGSMNVIIKGLEGYIADKFKIWYLYA